MIPKFRAWDKTDKEMYLVDEINFNRGEFESIGDAITFKREADEVELMQSTGLFDKNGKDIFEGDILKVANNDSSWFEVVKYDHDKAMFISKEVNLKYEVPETPLYDLFSPYLFKVEVIGNIWENRDLLGVE
nr:MAG TPA: YopX protein [Caudoviricetes sp.]